MFLLFLSRCIHSIRQILIISSRTLSSSRGILWCINIRNRTTLSNQKLPFRSSRVFERRKTASSHTVLNFSFTKRLLHIKIYKFYNCTRQQMLILRRGNIVQLMARHKFMHQDKSKNKKSIAN